MKCCEGRHDFDPNLYLFPWTHCRLAQLTDLTFLNYSSIQTMKDIISAIVPDFSVCAAINPCDPDLDILLGFNGVSVEFQVSRCHVTFCC